MTTTASRSRFSFFYSLLLLALFVGSSSAAAFSPSSSSSSVQQRQRQRQQRVWGVSSSTTTVLAGGPAILDRPETLIEKKRNADAAPTKERKGMGNEAWEVRIYNDGFNTREYVARSLVQITGMAESTAYQTMMQAHQNGIAVVGRWVYEIAEMYHDALKNNGLVCDIVPVDEE